VTVVVACVAMPAGCATGTHSARRARPHRPLTTTTRPTTTTTAPLITYHVLRGDTLTSIAKRFRTSAATIVFVNRLADPDHLTEGQTLLIPPPAPLALHVTPAQGHAGEAFQLDLTGAKPAEAVVFEIDSPAGKYTGRPHIAADDGSVTATYLPSVANPAGTYEVIATGNLGTTARTSFRVVAGAQR
jgi:LysM repeat protein